MIRAKAAAMVACAVLLTPRAEAASSPSRALLVGPPDDELSHRVQLELAARGFLVARDAHFDPAHPAAPIHGLVVVVETSGAGVDIWTVADASPAHLLSRIAVRDDLATTAVRVAEVARAYAGADDPANTDDPARIDDPANTDDPARADKPANIAVASPSAPVLAPLAPRPAAAPRFEALAEAMWLLPISGFSSSLEANIGFRWHLDSRIALAGFVGYPLVRSSIRADIGTATVSGYHLGAIARLALLGRERAQGWRLGLGAGLALQWVSTEGETNAPYEARTSSVWGALPLVALDLGHTLGETFAIHGAAMVGTSVPSVAVRFANESMGSWASPMVGLSVGLTARIAERASP